MPERLWWLSLPKHANLPNGVPYNQKAADIMWGEFGSDAEEMKPGSHDLTPPTLRGLISTRLLVQGNFHGIHKIRQPNGILIIRLPENTRQFNLYFSVDDAPARLYYMLRWFQSPTQEIEHYQTERETVGAIF